MSDPVTVGALMEVLLTEAQASGTEIVGWVDSIEFTSTSETDGSDWSDEEK